MTITPLQGFHKSLRGVTEVSLSQRTSFAAFWPDYLGAHRDRRTRAVHYLGTSLGVADTMALISSKLSNLVPFSCCALFLHNEETETLRCRFATGLDSEIIQQISVKSGLGLTGWVARNRRAPCAFRRGR